MTGTTRPAIFGISGTVLTDAEKRFLEITRPIGVILFKRNIESLSQVKKLCADLRDAANDSDLIIAIDQEGGRVARLRPPLWPEYPPMRPFGSQYKTASDAAKKSVYDNFQDIGHRLLQLGITMNCAPVLDVPITGAHDVIGDRAFADDPKTVATLGREAALGLMAAGVFPVIKHIPGHGRATVDSHHDLPHVDCDHATLSKTDFAPFAMLRDMPFAMTAHVVYTAIDDKYPATLSKKIVDEIIRGEIGFDGLLMGDDLGMKALNGDFATLTRDSFIAGCDIALHCSGEMAEMQAVASALPSRLPDQAAAKLSTARLRISQRVA